MSKKMSSIFRLIVRLIAIAVIIFGFYALFVLFFIEANKIKQEKEIFIVIEKSKKLEMDRCEYKLENSEGKIIIYNDKFDNYKLGDTIKF